MERITIGDTDEAAAPDPDVRSSLVLTFPDEPTPDAVKDVYVADLEARVRQLVGSEPKDFARATILIYDIYRLGDEPETAREIAGLFDVPAVVLFQVPPLVRFVEQMGPTPTAAATDEALERIDDLSRLVIMALDGDTHADIVARLTDLGEAVRMTPRDPVRLATIAAAADSLIHLANAFFFDRLTAIPALRSYVVGLELGL